MSQPFVLPGLGPAVTLEESYAQCERLATSHYENFSVGSWLLPKAVRRHVYAMYAYSRYVDDLGDEVDGPNRLTYLYNLEQDVRRMYDGTPLHPMMLAIQDTAQRCQIPPEPFLKLIHANRMDQEKTRFETYDELAFYCDHSANPCGRLFLYCSGYRDPELQRLSDFTCTALQLTNFWQDVAIDWGKGRVYLPQEDLRRFGYREEDIAAQVVNPAFVELMKFEIARTREIFANGLALVDRLEGQVRMDVRLFTRGGSALLDGIEANGFDVYRRRPTVSKGKKVRLMLGETVRLLLGM